MRNEKRLNNTIYLMHLITQIYTEKHKLDIEEFLKLDKSTHLLSFVRKCPDIFDGLPNEEILGKVEEYINGKQTIQA